MRYLLSSSLRSVVAIDVVDGRPGAKKRGRGRGGNAGVGVNMSDGAGDDGSKVSAWGDCDSARLVDA